MSVPPTATGNNPPLLSAAELSSAGNPPLPSNNNGMLHVGSNVNPTNKDSKKDESSISIDDDFVSRQLVSRGYAPFKLEEYAATAIPKNHSDFVDPFSNKMVSTDTTLKRCEAFKADIMNLS